MPTPDEIKLGKVAHWIVGWAENERREIGAAQMTNDIMGVLAGQMEEETAVVVLVWRPLLKKLPSY
jgi:hypothetical protein